MKICHVAPELLPVPPTRGGATERWIRDAALRLTALGHELHVISRDHGDGRKAAILDGVHHHFVRIPDAIDIGRRAALARAPWYYWLAQRIIGRIQPDIVHHHGRPAILWLSRAVSSVPQVISLHNTDYGWGFGYRGWDRPLFSRGLAAAARVLCVSNFIRQHTIERYPICTATATTLYNGVDGRTFYPRHEGPAGAAPATILYVGRVESRKGVHVLLDAFEKWISPRLPDARLQVVGPHSYWQQLPTAYYTALSTRCQAHPRIELRGPTYVDSELAEIYRNATVSVVPSTFPEALGLTALEAQASGVPVVVSDSGGLPETVSPGRSGLIFANHDAEQLADAVIGLLLDEPRRRAMAAGARDWAMQVFSWDVIAGQLEAVYADVLQGQRAGVPSRAGVSLSS